MSRQTITGELKRWHHDLNSKGEKCVVGTMASSEDEIWANGDDVVFFYSEWIESVNFFLAVRGNIALKCPKDEEIKYAAKKFNGSDTPEKG